jgi:hypothetical protein
MNDAREGATRSEREAEADLERDAGRIRQAGRGCAMTSWKRCRNSPTSMPSTSA